MLVAMTIMIRNLGGGLGRSPRIRRTTRFMNPRGFFRPGHLGQQRLQGAHAAAAASCPRHDRHHAVDGSGGLERAAETLSGER